MIREREKKGKEMKDYKRSKSAPVIPIIKDIQCDDSRESTDSNKLVGDQTQIRIVHNHRVAKSKRNQYPCCDKDSDSENFCRAKPNMRRRTTNEAPYPKPPKKKGFLEACCPCCIKKRPMSRPSPNCNFDVASRPSTRSNGGKAFKNMKCSQTSPEDFKLAKKKLREAITEEKKRAKQQNKVKKSFDTLKKGEENEKLKHQKNNERINNEYIKARERYHHKRRKMEQEIEKSLRKGRKQTC